MKAIAVILFSLLAVSVISCSKKNKVELVSGTVDGLPAITLYGNSNKVADYIFLSSDSAHKEMSYNGVILTYVSGSPSPSIFILKSSVAIAKGRLTASGTKTALTIDTTYGFSFGSNLYTSY